MSPVQSQQASSPQASKRHSFHPIPNDRQCRALHKDGSDCREKLLQASHTLCPPHNQEYKKIYESYKLKEKRYVSIKIEEGEASTTERIGAKLAAGKETLELRDQVNRRFFNFSAQNRGHIKWILKLQSEVSDLGQKLAAREAREAASSSPPARTVRVIETTVYGSLLDPAVPMSRLSHLQPDSPVILLRKIVNATVAQLVQRIYSIVPALNDSSSVIFDKVSNTEREPDEQDIVLRFLFRELLLYKADADVLARATRTQSIDTFLRESFIEDLEYYLKFFEAFLEGRNDTLRLLRDAVCDYLLDPQSLSTTLLGAEVSTGEDSSRSMGIKGWDILFMDFHDIVGWWNIELFAIQFEDLVMVKSLIACLRYGQDDHGDDNVPTWYLPDEDVSQECVFAVLQGFIAVAKGFCEPDELSAETEKSIATEQETRCYLVGRMSKKDPMARQLAQELIERVARFQVLVYDREISELVSPPLTDKDPWIRRSRSTPTKKALSSTSWVTEWSLENILDDLKFLYDVRDRNMSRDYYEFIIIDRTPGRAFDILDVVADALSKLKGDMPLDQIIRQVIQKYFPAEEQDTCLKGVAQMDFGHATPPASQQYMGSRVRCWDVPGSVADMIRADSRVSSRVLCPSESRIIAKVSADLESHGVVALIPDYEPPRTSPIVMKGIDGLDDLYFAYDLGPIDESASRRKSLDLGLDTSGNNLVEFSQAYQHAHPSAVFAKGRINIHYCAWPAPMLTLLPHYSRLNFCTPEGRMYRWKALPFDVPLASLLWQCFVNLELNSKLPCVRLVQTTLVICAEDRDGAKASIKALLDIGKEHGWTFSIPPAASWTSDLKRLGLGTLWEGVRPAL
ncbi:hypothetical protein F5B20DRAFT_565710 [Whalleya microplaca]|nr:hypothetical protein F5B20DRAFT_565710 [Whalleya microplaca]